MSQGGERGDPALRSPPQAGAPGAAPAAAPDPGATLAPDTPPSPPASPPPARPGEGGHVRPRRIWPPLDREQPAREAEADEDDEDPPPPPPGHPVRRRPDPVTAHASERDPERKDDEDKDDEDPPPPPPGHPAQRQPDPVTAPADDDGEDPPPPPPGQPARHAAVSPPEPNLEPSARVEDDGLEDAEEEVKADSPPSPPRAEHVAHELGKTSLHRAAESGHAAVVEELIGAEADVAQVDKYGRTALHLAAQNGHATVVELLLGAGADVAQGDEFGRTALQRAAESGHATVVELLLGAGADVAQDDKYGRTALHLAAQSGHATVVELLLGAGADRSQATNDGKTALQLASDEAVVRLLSEEAEDEDEDEDKDMEATKMLPIYAPLVTTPDSVHVGALLYNGAYGVVHRGRFQGADVAVKRLPPPHVDDVPHQLRVLRREARAMCTARHPNIVSLIAYCDQAPDLFLVMELAEGGSLDRVLATRGAELPLSRRVHILRDVAAGMAALHANGVVHCDLKPTNVLVSSSLQAKVADFGLARVASAGSSSSPAAGHRAGTAMYKAPELFPRVTAAAAAVGPESDSDSDSDDEGGEPEGKVTDDVGEFARCTPASDVFSFGMLAYELVSGKRPWRSGGRAMTWDQIRACLHAEPPRLPKLKRLSPFFRGLVERCWAQDPADRPSFAAVLAELEAYAAASPLDDDSVAPQALQAGIQALQMGQARLQTGMDATMVQVARKDEGQEEEADEGAARRSSPRAEAPAAAPDAGAIADDPPDPPPPPPGHPAQRRPDPVTAHGSERDPESPDSPPEGNEADEDDEDRPPPPPGHPAQRRPGPVTAHASERDPERKEEADEDDEDPPPPPPGDPARRRPGPVTTHASEPDPEPPARKEDDEDTRRSPAQAGAPGAAPVAAPAGATLAPALRGQPARLADALAVVRNAGVDVARRALEFTSRFVGSLINASQHLLINFGMNMLIGRNLALNRADPDPDPEAAMRLHERALEADPRHVDSLFNRGLLLETQAAPDLEAARRLYERALEVDPLHVDSLCSLGIVLQNQADPDLEAAKRLFERALEANPRHVDSLCSLGYLLLNQADPDLKAAKRLFERALEVDPRHVDSLCSLGILLETQADPDLEAAKRLYERALEADPRHIPALFSLGLLYQNQADPDLEAAKRLYERALELRPSFKPALAGLRSLDQPSAPATTTTSTRPHLLTVAPADVEWLDFLERGSFGSVYMARHCGVVYAGKRLPSQAPDSREQLEHEARILSLVRHPNVIGFYGISTDPADCFVLLELAEGGSLATLLRRGNDTPLPLRFRILHDVVRGMCRLHSNVPQVLHRDLNPSNVLIMRDGQAKLADFGLSRLDSSSSGTSLQGGVGTVEYTAPELFADEECSPASDVFSFGVLAYEVLTGRRAWLNEHAEPLSMPKVVQQIVRGTRPPLPSPAADAFLQGVVERCWAEEPAARPSFAELLREFDGRAHEYPQPADMQTRIMLELLQVKERGADVAGRMGSPPPAGAS